MLCYRKPCPLHNFCWYMFKALICCVNCICFLQQLKALTALSMLLKEKPGKDVVPIIPQWVFFPALSTYCSFSRFVMHMHLPCLPFLFSFCIHFFTCLMRSRQGSSFPCLCVLWVIYTECRKHIEASFCKYTFLMFLLVKIALVTGFYWNEI